MLKYLKTALSYFTQLYVVHYHLFKHYILCQSRYVEGGRLDGHGERFKGI